MTERKRLFGRKEKDIGKREPLNVFTCLFMVVLLIYSAAMILLLFWALITSVKDRSDFVSNTYGFPSTWNFGNFATVLDRISVPVIIGGRQVRIGVLLQLIYSLLYAVGGAIIMAVVPCVVAYLTSNFKYKFSKFITGFVIVAMIIPIVGSQASELMLLRSLGLYDSIIGSWIQKFHFLGMYYLVFLGAFGGVSKEYSEAASIDGASEFTIMTRVVMPMVKTVIFTVFLIKFIELWNDYQTPMLYLPSYPTMAYGLYYMSVVNRDNTISTSVRLAGSIMLALPIIILFSIFKNRLIGNLSMGGVKE